jgi:hypothetical protein
MARRKEPNTAPPEPHWAEVFVDSPLPVRQALYDLVVDSYVAGFRTYAVLRSEVEAEGLPAESLSIDQIGQRALEARAKAHFGEWYNDEVHFPGGEGVESTLRAGLWDSVGSISNPAASAAEHMDAMVIQVSGWRTLDALAADKTLEPFASELVHAVRAID